MFLFRDVLEEDTNMELLQVPLLRALFDLRGIRAAACDQLFNVVWSEYLRLHPPSVVALI